MSTSTDERGRLYIPKEVRDRFGDRYRIVELPSHVALFPVDEDPLEGVRSAVGDALDDSSVEELQERAREAVAAEAAAEAGERPAGGED